MLLSTEDLKHLTVAQGYVELGMFPDANEELEEIDPEVRHVPEVLAVRVEIYRALEKWELMQTVAKKLTEHDPENPRWPLAWAFATRRADSLDAARRILVEAWKVHEKEPLFPFNIACYMCQLGQVEIAKGMLEVAFKMDRGMRMMALDDEDLRPLWDSIAAL
jgi:lipopolysaccharide biosynthesis regulator YciM